MRIWSQIWNEIILDTHLTPQRPLDRSPCSRRFPRDRPLPLPHRAVPIQIFINSLLHPRSLRLRIRASPSNGTVLRVVQAADLAGWLDRIPPHSSRNTQPPLAAGPDLRIFARAYSTGLYSLGQSFVCNPEQPVVDRLTFCLSSFRPPPSLPPPFQSQPFISLDRMAQSHRTSDAFPVLSPPIDSSLIAPASAVLTPRRLHTYCQTPTAPVSS
ncbi:hypothetical protein BD414DRAFT_499303 [Trametes punicea]|nr:hypothetical protein BD414DRAFT_499303 [Trametes punicea]